MQVFQINSLTQVPLRDQVTEITKSISSSTPPSSIVIMIHGYQFDHRQSAHCPHATMFNPNPVAWDFRTRSWPDELKAHDTQSVAIGFSWPSRGKLKDAYDTAAQAGVALADLIKQLRAAYPDVAIQLMSHSLGARVALCAFPLLQAGDVTRALFLFPSEYKQAAEQALKTDLGKSAEILCVASTENYIFEQLFYWKQLAGAQAGPPFGRYQPDQSNVVTLWIDRPDVIADLNARGIDIGPREKRICHWSAYTRRGIFNLYGRWLLVPQSLPIHIVRRIAISDTGSTGAPDWGVQSPA